MTVREFPVLRDARATQRFPHGRTSVPWCWVAPYERQAQRNHSQSLLRLAERGGLSPAELYCVVNGQSLRPFFDGTLTADKAEQWLARWDGTGILTVEPQS